MQVVYTNANNESEMVYGEIICAIIIANLPEIATTNTFNSLRHAISQWMRGFPSRFEFKMFRILLQECTLINNNRHVLFFENTWKYTKYLKHTWNILQKNPVGLKPPSRLFLFLFMMCYHCMLFLFKQKQILANYRKKPEKYTHKTFEARNHPPGFIFGPYSWFVIIAFLLLFKQKQILENTGNTEK